MGKLAGVPHLKAVRALEKAGFRIIRQSKHITMSDGKRHLTVPRANPIDAYTMGGIIRDAEMTIDEFRRPL
ncbi:MAG: type II toxin-antitoxin system HicA family toxin [Bryobacteraceae bacterium]